MATSEMRAALVAMATAGGMTPDAFRALGGVNVLKACADDMAFIDENTAIALGAVFPGNTGFSGGGPPNDPTDSSYVPSFAVYRPTYSHAARMIAGRMSVDIAR